MSSALVPQGWADAIEEWKARVPPLKTMVGRPKGRSLKGIRTRIGTLMSDERTVEEGIRLKAYLSILVVCNSLHPDNIKKIPPAEVRALVKKATHEGVELPPSVQITMLDYEIDQAIAQRDNLKALRITSPFPQEGSESFDILAPMVSTMPKWSSTQKIELFRKAFLGRVIAPLVQEGAEKADELQAILTPMYNNFEAVDIVEADNAEAKLIDDISVGCKSVLSLISFPWDPSAVDDLNKLDKFKGKSTTSVLTTFATAIQASEYFTERWNLFRRILPAIVELGPAVKSSMSVVAEAACEFQEPVMDLMKCASTVVVRCRSSDVPAEMYESLENDLWALLCGLLEKARCSGFDISLPLATMRAAKAMADEATSAFPSKPEVLQLKGIFSDAMSSRTAGQLLDSFIQLIDSLPGEFFKSVGEESDKMWSNLEVAASECVGLDLDASRRKKLSDFAGAVFIEVAVQQDPDNEGAFDAIMGLLDKVCGIIDEKVTNWAMDCATLNMKLVTKMRILQDEGAPITEKLGDLHELAVALRQATAKMDEFPGTPKDAWAKILVERMNSQTSRAQKVQQASFDLFLKAKASCVQAALVDLSKGLSGLDSAPPWHQGVPKTGSWQQILDAGEKLTKCLDVPKVISLIAKGRLAVDEYKATLERNGDNNDDDLTRQATEKLNAALILKVEVSMLWHLTQETDAETLRDKLGAEAKLLRKQGISDKEVFHPVFFRKCLAGLRMRGSAPA